MDYTRLADKFVCHISYFISGLKIADISPERYHTELMDTVKKCIQSVDDEVRIEQNENELRNLRYSCFTQKEENDVH